MLVIPDAQELKNHSHEPTYKFVKEMNDWPSDAKVAVVDDLGRLGRSVDLASAIRSTLVGKLIPKEDIFEVRTEWDDVEYRIGFLHLRGCCYLLVAFKKDTQKTEKKILKTLSKRAAVYRCVLSSK